MENTNTPQNNNHDYGVTTNDIMDFLKENMATKEDPKGMATKEDLKGMATKEDLGRLKLDLIDAMADKSSELRGDIVVLMRKEDRKVVSLIELLKQKKLISENEARAVLALEPFPQLSV